MASAEDFSEKRHYDRYLMRELAHFLEAGNSLHGSIEDVSLGGFSFISQEEYKIGDQFLVDFNVHFRSQGTIRGTNENTHRLATIVWKKDMPKGRFRYGVEFHRLNDPFALKEQIAFEEMIRQAILKRNGRLR